MIKKFQSFMESRIDLYKKVNTTVRQNNRPTQSHSQGGSTIKQNSILLSCHSANDFE